MELHIHYRNQRKLPYAFLCLFDRMTFYHSCEPSKSAGIKCWHFSRIWAWSRHASYCRLAVGMMSVKMAVFYTF